MFVGKRLSILSVCDQYISFKISRCFAPSKIPTSSKVKETPSSVRSETLSYLSFSWTCCFLKYFLIVHRSSWIWEIVFMNFYVQLKMYLVNCLVKLCLLLVILNHLCNHRYQTAKCIVEPCDLGCGFLYNLSQSESLIIQFTGGKRL